MSQNDLEDKLRQIAGEEYGKGTDAEEIVSSLESVKERFDHLAEIDQ